MLYMGLDYETNGLDTNNCAVVELGWAVYKTGCNIPLTMHNFIVDDRKAYNYGDWKQSMETSHIGEEEIQNYGVEAPIVLEQLWKDSKECSFILASNGNRFDKPLQQALHKRYTMDDIDLPWVDLQIDVPFPLGCRHRELMYLAAYHGFINPFSHRALPDVLTMVKVFKNYNEEEIYQDVMNPSPPVTLIAHVSYENRHLASERGFRWTGAPLKYWVKNVNMKWMEKNMDVVGEYPFQFDMKEGAIG